MADVTPILIKDLAAQTTLQDTDYFIVGGEDAKKITVGQMKEALGINELNAKITWKIMSIPSPTISGNKRTYSFDEPLLNKELAITINAQGYAVIDSRIILFGSERRYCISYDDGAYQWSADIRIIQNSIIVSGISSNASLSSYPVVLSGLSIR